MNHLPQHITFYLFFLWVSAHAQPPSPTFRHHGPREGMGMAFHKLLVDRQGFLWCASSNGLYRYDGYEFQFLKKYNQSGQGVSSDFIYDLTEDVNGDIWVATYNGGINRWERQTGRFHEFRHEPGDEATLCADRVQYLHLGSRGQIWAIVKNRAGQPVLDRLDPATGRVTHLRHDPLRPAAAGNGQVNQITRAGTPLRPLLTDPRGRTWVAFRDGLFCFDPGSTTPRAISYPDPDGTAPFHLYPSPADGNRVWVLFATPDLRRGHPARLDLSEETLSRLDLPPGLALQAAPMSIAQRADEPDRLWLSGKALHRIDLSKGTFETYNPKRPEAPEVTGAIRDSLFTLQTGPRGRFWLLFPGPDPTLMVRGSEDYFMPNGAHTFDPETEEFTYLETNPTDPTQPLGMAISLYEDPDRNLWLGAYPGFYQIRFSQNDGQFRPRFRNYDLSGGDLTVKDEARDAWEASPDHLWLAMESGLKRLTLPTGDLLSFRHDATDESSIGGTRVIALFADEANDKLWIGHENGLDWVSLAEARKERPALRFRHVDDRRLAGMPVTEIAPGPAPYLWIGTKSGGLLRFDPDRGEVERSFRPAPNDSTTISDALINGVFTDRRGNTWVAAGMGGICRMIREGRGYRFERFLEGMFITDLYEDRTGRLWLAAMNYGIAILYPGTGKYELLTMEDQLERSSVLGIEEDDQRRIWFTSLGVAKYDPRSEVYRSFRREAGVLEEDPARLFYQMSDGRIVYAGLNGQIQVFNPNQVEDNPHPPRPVLTGLRLLNRPVTPSEDGPLLKNIEVTEKIVLPYRRNTFAFEYVGIELGDPASVRYEYRLEGADEEWVSGGKERIARYTQLAPGAYTFRVRAYNGDGVLSEQEATVQVTIRHPWWMRWWAFLLYGLLAGLAIYRIADYRRRRWQLKQQLAFEHKEAERLKQLDEAKTRLFTNISHEFRTPLTVIKGMAQQIRKDPEKWAPEGTARIERNTDQLLLLVNQMLDLRKLEAGMLQTHPEPREFIGDLAYYLDAFRTLADAKDIQLHFVCEHEILWLETDPDLLGKILSNLLSNAVKFTPPGGHVYLLVDAGDQLSIRVRDTGIGIPEKALPYIFDRFYQAVPAPDQQPVRADQGTGIGLALTRELVRLLNGTIEVSSQAGKGSTFHVRLPLQPAQPIPSGKSEPPRVGELPPAAPLPEGPSPHPGKEESPSLLIVEDSADVARFLEILLGDAYRLSFAANGQEGIDRALKEVPDFIISDVMMPVKDGFELCKTLKNDPRTSHIPILLLTARADEQSRVAGLRRGADAYLAKPFDREELLVRVEALLALRRQLRERYTDGDQAPPSPSFELEDAFLQRARAVVEERYADPEFNVHHLYQALNLSRTQLHNKLTALTGQSASLFIRSVRLRKGRELLRATDLSVKEVAFSVGFGDSNFFSRCYKQEFGRSPSRDRGG